MKIISRTEFFKMPKGTVFCKFPVFDEKTRTYRTYEFGIQEPSIKMNEPGEMENDYYIMGIGSSLHPEVSEGCVNDFEILEDMEQHRGKEVPFVHSFGRDGMFETDKEVCFAIFSRNEVELMIKELQDALETGYKTSTPND